MALSIITKNLAFHSIYNEELELNFDYVAGINVAHKFPLHIHESLCIGLITKGDRDIVLSGKKVTIHQGEIFVINKNQPHAISQTEQHDYIVITIKGLPDIIPFHNIIKSDICVDLFLQLFSSLKNGETDTLPEKWNNLYKHLSDTHNNLPASPDSDEAFIMKSIEYIKHNYRNQIQIKDIASHVCMSTFHFCRLFKQSTGLSPHNYLKQYRLSQSYKRLKHKTPVFDTAIETGFYDSSHFIKTFHSYMAVSPGKYQESVTKKQQEHTF